ncbi:hypothetical protein GCM10017673_45060 [Streptosporangium violaceochromogenes]|nr:hypothetical protein GCM10017673_45060 [Streptosporangium violaceochromogenes]
MIGQPRLPGRHRAGQAPTTVHRRAWDGPARAEAERLERSRPGWVVLYGVGSRRFYAMAAWPVSEPVMVSDPTAEGLEERMGEAEAALLLRSAPSRPTSVPAGPIVVAPERVRRRPHPARSRRTATTARGLPYPPEGPSFPRRGNAA